MRPPARAYSGRGLPRSRFWRGTARRLSLPPRSPYQSRARARKRRPPGAGRPTAGALCATTYGSQLNCAVARAPWAARLALLPTSDRASRPTNASRQPSRKFYGNSLRSGSANRALTDRTIPRATKHCARRPLYGEGPCAVCHFLSQRAVPIAGRGCRASPLEHLLFVRHHSPFALRIAANSLTPFRTPFGSASETQMLQVGRTTGAVKPAVFPTWQRVRATEASPIHVTDTTTTCMPTCT